MQERQQKLRRLEQKIIQHFEEQILDKSFIKTAEMKDQDRFKFVCLNFTEWHRFNFLSFVMEYGIDYPSIEEFWIDLCKKKSPIFGVELKPSQDDFKKYLKEFYAGLLCRQKLNHQDNAFFCGLDPTSIMRRIGGMSLLKRRLTYFNKKPERFRIPHKSMFYLFIFQIILNSLLMFYLAGSC